MFLAPRHSAGRFICAADAAMGLEKRLWEGINGRDDWQECSHSFLSSVTALTAEDIELAILVDIPRSDSSKKTSPEAAQVVRSTAKPGATTKPAVVRKPDGPTTQPEIIEILSSSEDEDVLSENESLPVRPRRRLRRFYTNIIDEDSDVEMEDSPLQLPPLPAFHPITKAPNIAKADANYDPDQQWDVFAVLDRTNYENPNQAYLVQWCDDTHRFCATWVWRDSLLKDGFGKEMSRIDKWKDQYSTLSYAEFNTKFPSTFKASVDGRCFFKALRIACHVLEEPNLVPLELIKEFQHNHVKEKEGVSNTDISQFLDFLRKRRAPLSCDVFNKNILKHSLNKYVDLANYPLAPGVYVVGAACPKSEKHCFVLQVYEDGKERRAFDRWQEGGGDNEFYDEPVSNLQWIRRCNFIRRVERAPKKFSKRGGKKRREKLALRAKSK